MIYTREEKESVYLRLLVVCSAESDARRANLNLLLPLTQLTSYLSLSLAVCMLAAKELEEEEDGRKRLALSSSNTAAGAETRVPTDRQTWTRGAAAWHSLEGKGLLSVSFHSLPLFYDYFLLRLMHDRANGDV